MLSRTRQIAARAVARRPIYRLLPRGALRTYAALRYHQENSDPTAVVRYIRSVRRAPTWPLPTAIFAAKAVFRAGLDDVLDDALTALRRRHPKAAAVDLLYADLHTYYGRPEQALGHAERARRAAPGSAAAMASVVRLSYRVRPRADAERVAVAAVREFPLSPESLWAVAMHCDDPDQYARIQTAWDGCVPEQGGLLRVARQLAVAASRAGEVSAAADLYRSAIGLAHARTWSTTRPSRTRLDGLGARKAIEDLTGCLDDAGIPFFFAAGTALGLVREGRPLSADGDIDLGVLDDDWDRERLIELFSRDPRFDLDLHPQTTKVGLRHRGGAPVDIFRFYQEHDRVWHDGVFVRWHNTPFTVVRRQIGGLALPLPADPDTYLTENYRDWRTPNPAFDAFADAPNLEITWPEYHRVHLLRRAYECMMAGDATAAGRELRRAGNAELAEKIA